MKVLALVLAAIMSMAMPILQAGVVIDFESVGSGNLGPVPGTPFNLSTQGFTFSSSAAFSIENTPSSTVPNHSGNVLVDSGAGSDSIQMASTDGSTFSLVNLVAGPGLKNRPFAPNPFNAQVLNLTGTISGGGIVSTSFNLAGGYTTFDLPAGWDNLTAIHFYGSGAPSGGNSIALDDIFVSLNQTNLARLNEVPEPGSLLLLATGFFACSALLRAKRKRQEEPK